jgi:hypothetical protein
MRTRERFPLPGCQVYGVKLAVLFPPELFAGDAGSFGQ